MCLRSYVLHAEDLEAGGLERANRGLTPGAGAFHGHTELREWAEGFLAAWESHHAEVVELLEADHSIVAILHLIGRGSGSGIEQEDLRWALVEGAVIPEQSIRSIRVLDRFSFVELGAEEAGRAVSYLDGTKLKGKQIRMEVARS